MSLALTPMLGCGPAQHEPTPATAADAGARNAVAERAWLEDFVTFLFGVRR